MKTVVLYKGFNPRTFAPQMSFFGDYDSRGKSCRLVHTPQRPLKV